LFEKELESEIRISGFLTFILGHFYLSYKINEAKELKANMLNKHINVDAAEDAPQIM